VYWKASNKTGYRRVNITFSFQVENFSFILLLGPEDITPLFFTDFAEVMSKGQFNILDCVDLFGLLYNTVATELVVEKPAEQLPEKAELTKHGITIEKMSELVSKWITTNGKSKIIDERHGMQYWSRSITMYETRRREVPAVFKESIER
jgi:hypothetical protein